MATTAIGPLARFYAVSDVSKRPLFFKSMINAELLMQDFSTILSAQVYECLRYSERNDKILYFTRKSVPITL